MLNARSTQAFNLYWNCFFIDVPHLCHGWSNYSPVMCWTWITWAKSPLYHLWSYWLISREAYGDLPRWPELCFFFETGFNIHPFSGSFEALPRGLEKMVINLFNFKKVPKSSRIWSKSVASLATESLSSKCLHCIHITSQQQVWNFTSNNRFSFDF